MEGHSGQQPSESGLITGTVLLPGQIASWWNLLVPLIDKPLKQMRSTDRYPLQYVKDQLLAGVCQAWVIYRKTKIVAVLVTHFRYYPGPKGKFMDIFLVGGWKMEEWFPYMWTYLKEFAKREGCCEVQGGGRLGWHRFMKKVEPNLQAMSYIVVEI